MRKIEKEMLTAIIARKNWSKDNTRVERHTRQDGKPLMLVFLHDNQIATIGGDVDERRNVCITLAGWNTPTTRSRVSRILCELGKALGVSTRKGQARVIFGHFADVPHTEKEISDSEWVCIA